MLHSPSIRLDDPGVFLRQLLNVAVQSALPQQTLARYLPTPPDPAKGRTLVLGAGKAGGAMAHALEVVWPHDAPLKGLVVTRYGHTPSRPRGAPSRVEIIEASHPVPDASGQAAAQRMRCLTQGLSANDLVLCLISGGGSALLTEPCAGLTLADKQRINRELLTSGASIVEMNCVRKHLSAIKGGRLAQLCHPARVVTLAISDVPGDDLGTIASGPTVADTSTCAEALAVLDRYRIAIPDAVREGLRSAALETPKPGQGVFADSSRHSTHLIATPMQSLLAAADCARAAGLNAYVLSDEIEGESREVGKVHAALARSTRLGRSAFQAPCVILSGGETTVCLRPHAPGATPGRGGRAGEFCMGLAHGLQGMDGIWALAADTDGIDGVENNAGALVTPDTLPHARTLGLSLADHMDRNDAWTYFHALGDLVLTGPTHTNVNDFRAVLVL